jgi:hypothetical protein
MKHRTASHKTRVTLLQLNQLSSYPIIECLHDKLAMAFARLPLEASSNPGYLNLHPSLEFCGETWLQIGK